MNPIIILLCLILINVIFFFWLYNEPYSIHVRQVPFVHLFMAVYNFPNYIRFHISYFFIKLTNSNIKNELKICYILIFILSLNYLILFVCFCSFIYNNFYFNLFYFRLFIFCFFFSFFLYWFLFILFADMHYKIAYFIIIGDFYFERFRHNNYRRIVLSSTYYGFNRFITFHIFDKDRQIKLIFTLQQLKYRLIYCERFHRTVTNFLKLFLNITKILNAFIFIELIIYLFSLVNL